MANAYQREFAESMARVARLPAIQTVAVETPQEPISINAVRQVRDLLIKEGIRSVVVVSPAMRSRRSELIYTAVLVPEGISVGCVPAFGTTNTENWLETWHGIQEVLEQYLKLQYYRIFVL